MNSEHAATIRKPFIEHVHELQKRLTWCVLAVGIGASIGYAFYDQLLLLVQKPIGQTLYYTSPTGGFSFLFKLCIAAGFVIALPVIIYHIFGFLGPLLRRKQKSLIVAYTLWSFNLAYAGVLFAYLISLPAALHFLAKFGGGGVQSLITVDEYFNFALAYIAGFAVMFQLPLLILFVNRIKPLTPGSMMSAQRYVILVSFIVAAILTPTPDPVNQLLMAAPAIILYQVAIILVMVINRKSRATKRAAARNATAHPPLARQHAKAHKPVAVDVPAKIYPVSNQAHLRRTTRKYIDIIPPSYASIQPMVLDTIEQDV